MGDTGDKYYYNEMDIVGKIAAIDALKAEIDSHGKLPDKILNKVNYKFRLDWNFYSNTMEGNTLTRSETRSIMIGNVTIDGKPLKDVLEVKGHDEVVQQILQIGNGELNVSEKRIKELHRAIMHEEDPEKKALIGEWKKDQNEIINYKQEKFCFTRPSEVKEEMHNLINWLNAEAEKIKFQKKEALHPAILALEFHIRYLTIHPFFDGNGRTARILMNLILISFGYPPVIINSTDKVSYYQYLADVQCYDAPKDFYYNLMLALLQRSLEIVHKAVKGEEIEEPDDLDKEISLFITSLKNKKDLAEVRGTKENRFKIVQEVLLPFAVSLRAQIKEFDQLFNEGIFLLNFKAGNKNYSLYLVKDKFIEENHYFIQDFFKDLINIDVSIDEVVIQISWKGFKYNKYKPYDVTIYSQLAFEEYNYIFNRAHMSDIKAEVIKLYNEDISAEEQVKIIKEVKKQVFDKVKGLYEEGK